MPRMPEVDDLRTVEGISPGVAKQPRDFISPAIQNLGQSVTGAGDRLYAQAEADSKEETALQFAKARVDWTEKRLTADDGFDLAKNPDYEKWNKIYDETVPKMAEASAAIIKDPKAREKFLLETRTDILTGRLAVNDRAGKIGREKQLAEFSVGLETAAAAAGKPGISDEESNRIIERTGASLGNLEEAGVITPGQRIEMQAAFARKVANVKMGWKTYYDPVGALKWLNPGAADGANIPITVANQPGRVSKGSTEGIQPAVLSTWQKTLNGFGRSVPIVSGFRDEETNKKAGGAKQSQHLHGNAIDVDVAGMPPQERRRLIETASAAGFTGIGVYKNSLHFDKGNRRTWGSAVTAPWAYSALARHKAGVPSPAIRGDLWSRLVQAESGGDQSAVSPKGARGRAQIMPATAPEAAKLAGLKWDPALFNGTDEAAAQYNEALGKAYLNEQLKTFGGDQAKALAAYNAGPGATKMAIAKYGDNWLSHMPEETQNYVAKITGGSDGPSEPIPDFVSILPPEDILAFTKQAEAGAKKLYEIEQNNLVQKAADTVYDQYADDAAKAYEALRSIPDAETRQEAEKLYDARVAREKTIAEENTKAERADLYSAVTAPDANVNDSLTRIAASGLTPGDKEWFKKIAIDGPPRYDDQSTVDMLERLQALDEQAFIGLDLGRPEYAGKLSSKTLLDFRKAQQTAEKALSGDDSKESKTYTEKRNAVNDADKIVTNGLQQIGVVTTGKDATQQDAKIAQEIRTMAGKRIEKLFDKLGRRPLESEIDDELKHMWKTIGQKPGGILGFGADPGQQLDDVLREFDDAGYDITRARQSLERAGKPLTVENFKALKATLDKRAQ